MSTSNSIVTLDVGGFTYRTTRSTLTRYPDSMLGAMFAGDMDTLQDDQGRYFIDRDGTLFQYVLNFLRTSQLVLPADFKKLSMLEIEADFYQIQPLIEAVKSYKAPFDQKTCEKPTTLHDVVLITVTSLDKPLYKVRMDRHDIPSRTSDYVQVVSTRKVEVMVSRLMDKLSRERDQQEYAIELLKGLQDNGFTVQSYGVIPDKDKRFDHKHIWVLVRQTIE